MAIRMDVTEAVNLLHELGCGSDPIILLSRIADLRTNDLLRGETDPDALHGSSVPARKVKIAFSGPRCCAVVGTLADMVEERLKSCYGLRTAPRKLPTYKA